MRRFRVPFTLALLLLLATSLGCAFGEVRWDDPLQREISLEDAQHRYTVLVRFGDFEKAVKFVEPAERDTYLAGLPNLRQLRFTEYESDRVTVDAEKSTSTIEVTYFAYTSASPIEMQVIETQEWYRHPGLGNHWYVRSTFKGLDALLALE